jgi:hypothetical protein
MVRQMPAFSQLQQPSPLFNQPTATPMATPTALQALPSNSPSFVDITCWQLIDRMTQLKREMPPGIKQLFRILKEYTIGKDPRPPVQWQVRPRGQPRPAGEAGGDRSKSSQASSTRAAGAGQSQSSVVTESSSSTTASASASASKAAYQEFGIYYSSCSALLVLR